MNRNLFATCILALAFAGAASAQNAASSAETGAHYTKVQVKELALNAHAPEQYAVLAGYYGAQKADYLRQAAEEKKEWERRSKNVSVAFGKYPRPVDSARNLYEYYLYKASKAETLQAKFSQLAAPNAPVNAE
jgi:ABC-type nitrate/sulfonate/bicarbonate transport system substrate-binding protein